MYEKTVLDITVKLAALGRENHMKAIFKRSFRGDMRLCLRINCTGFTDVYLYSYPRNFDRFKARFESYLINYFCETNKAANEIAARTYKEIERAHEDSEPFRIASVD